MIFEGVEVEEILGYEGLYAVSRCGKVWSIERLDSMGRKQGGKWVKGMPDKWGYPRVTLHKNSIVKYHKIHLLVSIQYIPNLDHIKFNQVNHIDGNKANNHFINLEWVTNRENSHHAVDIKLHHPNRTSLYRGVCFDKCNNKWKVCIQLSSINKHIGVFYKEIDAAIAYNNFIIENNLDIPLNVIEEQ